MTKVIIKAEFKVAEKENNKIVQAINKKFSDTITEYVSVPRIGEWIDLLELSDNYDLSRKDLKWLSVEAELDIDKIWPEEA